MASTCGLVGQDRQRRHQDQEDAARDTGEDAPGEAPIRCLYRVRVLVAHRRRQLGGSLRGLRRLEDLRARYTARLGHLRLRRVVARRCGIKDGPDALPELDLDPGADIRSTQGSDTALRAALGVGTHDDASVDAQLVEHEGHEGRVLLVVADQVLVAGNHALEAVGAHAGTRELRVFVEVVTVGRQVVLDRARGGQSRRRVLRQIRGHRADALGHMRVLRRVGSN